MEGQPPLVLTVYDKDLTYQGVVTRPLEVDAIARDNAVGEASFILDADDDITEALDEPGARIVVQYRPDPVDDPHTLLYHVGGPVQSLDGTSGKASTKTYTALDDWSLLGQIMGRPVPAGGLASGQGTGAWASTGPAETVVKAAVTANAATVPTPIVVAPDLGRGETISVSLRMDLLADKLFPALDFAHVSITLRQVDDEIVLDARAPVLHTVPVTERSGLVTGTYNLTRPTATRVMVAGGEVSGVTKFRQVINAAAEAQWGFCGWAPLVTATDTTSDAVMDAKGWESLNQRGPRTGLAVELAETDEWRYGVAFHLGDELPIRLDGAPLLTDRVSECRITWTKNAGLEVVPSIGRRTNDPNQILADAIAQVARNARTTTTGRV